MNFDPGSFHPYISPHRFAAITSYFNPNRYRTKKNNYEIFRRSMEVSGIPCITVECVFPGIGADIEGPFKSRLKT